MKTKSRDERGCYENKKSRDKRGSLMFETRVTGYMQYVTNWE